MAAVIKQKQNNYKLRYNFHFDFDVDYEFDLWRRKWKLPTRAAAKQIDPIRHRKPIRKIMINLNLSWKAGERGRRDRRDRDGATLSSIEYVLINHSLTHSFIHSFAIIKQNLQRKRKQSAKTSESHETKIKHKVKDKRKS